MRPTLLLSQRSYIGESKIRFRLVSPIVINNRLKGTGLVEKEKGCVHEFTLLMDCLQKHSYENRACPEEAKNFSTCYTEYNAKKMNKREKNKKELTPNSKTYTIDQINKYLKDFK